jgi:hypothetical protein
MPEWVNQLECDDTRVPGKPAQSESIGVHSVLRGFPGQWMYASPVVCEMSRTVAVCQFS